MTPHVRSPWGYLIPLGAGAGSLAIGLLAAQAPAAAVGAVLLGLAAMAVAIPPAYWAFAAVAAALTSQGLVTLGVLPGFATYLDLPLAWGAFALAIATRRLQTTTDRVLVSGICGLAAITLLSALFSGSEPLRPVFYFAVLAEPFAVVAALVVSGLDSRATRIGTRLALGLALVQIPLAVVQRIQQPAADDVQGTLTGSADGHHLISAVAVVCAFWLLAKPATAARITGILGLLLVPFLASAKQVIFALPAVFVASTAGGRLNLALRAAIVLGAVLVLIATPALNNRYSLTLIEETVAGEGGKNVAAQTVWDVVSSDPASFVLGAGPAETVSAAAYLTTDPVRDASSPVAVLDLEPASIPLEQGALSESVGSFDRPRASALGVLGDLGVLGALAYVSLFGFLFVTLYRIRSPEAAGATAGLALMFVLGFVSTWWEDSPFTLYVALIAGLALTGSARASEPA